jgi:hypothetical protein
LLWRTLRKLQRLGWTRTVEDEAVAADARRHGLGDVEGGGDSDRGVDRICEKRGKMAPAESITRLCPR